MPIGECLGCDPSAGKDVVSTIVQLMKTLFSKEEMDMKFSKHPSRLSVPGAEQGCPEGQAPAPGQQAPCGQKLQLASPAP